MSRSKIYLITLLAGIALVTTVTLCILRTDALPDTSVITTTPGSESSIRFVEEVPASTYNQDVLSVIQQTADTLLTTKSTTDIITTYYSSQKEGIVGSYGRRKTDNPADNLFTVTIDRRLNPSDKVWLQYELTGVNGLSGVTRSINDRLATGGYLVHLSDSITLQKEQLNPSWLIKGENRILFSLPEGASYGYKIANLTLVVEKGRKEQESNEPFIIITANESYGHKAYIRGYLGEHKKANIIIDKVEIPVNDGEFETVLHLAGNRTATVAAKNTSGVIAEHTLCFNHDFPLDREYAWSSYKVKKTAKTVQKEIADSLTIGSATLNIPQGTLLSTSEMSITELRTMDMPVLDVGMINVTNETPGYRFLPHGENFTQGATVALKYDRTKIPSGYTENDIHTYYFDNNTRHWVALERDTINRELCMVVSHTTHFTDMINGIIQTPESPETEGFAPTMMTDIKAADPTAKIEVIAPPTANNNGTAGLSYSFEMPPARNGMSPQLGLQYNSDGGSGWCGEGWDINTPSISIDTRWGVPRYNFELETETYIMDGEMLVTMDDRGQSSVAHRGDKIARTPDRQFYPRNEGAFSRIIRKGTDPGNYTWEVTDKSGTVYYYGGPGATLSGTVTTLNGQQKPVIARWMLKKVVELHGDYVEYKYNIVDETIKGNLKAKAIYLAAVEAGNKGDAPHTVVTFINDTNKGKQTNNGRYGFLNSSNKLLSKVTVYFEGSVLRSYGFTYKQGAFLVDLLDKLTHYDDNGEEVASHRLEYYDDVRTGEKEYQPFSSNAQTWNTGDDNLDGSFILPWVSDQASALNSSITETTGFTGFAGVGFWDGGAGYKSSTAGASYSYSSSTTEGKVTMIDINGDGLPDKVFEKGGRLYYRPNQSKPGGTIVEFGPRLDIKGINKLSYTKGRTNSYGGKLNPGWGPLTATIGKDKSTTNTDQTIYFTDVNNDGLPDLVMNSRVYFNHLEYDDQGYAIPTFTLSSADTPSPIMGGGNIDASDSEPDPEEQAELLRTSPLYDAVRVWEAPFDGIINISGTVQLQLPTGDYDELAYEKADGVRVAIQLSDSELWNEQIPKGDDKIYDALLNNISVTKGQRVYFRLQSGNQEMSNGSFDKVEWYPTITYTGQINRTNPDEQSTITFPASEGEVMSDVSGLVLFEAAPIVISGNFVKPVTSDSITLRVMLSNDMQKEDGSDNPKYQVDTVYIRTFDWDETYDGDLSFDIPNMMQGTHLAFQISANTNVAWNEVVWQPVATYTASGNEQIVPATVEYTLHSLQMHNGWDYQVLEDTVLNIKPVLKWNTKSYPATGKMTVAVKNVTGLLAKREYSFEDGIIITPDSIIDSLSVSQGALWIEYYSIDSLLLARIDSAKVQIMLNDPLAVPDSIPVNFFSQRQPDGFGPMYRGWGQFIYNSAEGRYANPIKEALLVLPQDSASADILTMPFIPFIPDNESKSFWVGIDRAVFINGKMMSASRLGEKDVVLTNPLANLPGVTVDGVCRTGSGAIGVPIKSVSKGDATVKAISFLSKSDSKGTESAQNGFMDLNGDGYPDIITSNQVQYTNTRGGFDGEILKGTFTQGSSNESDSKGLGGNSGIFSLSALSGMAKSYLVSQISLNNATYSTSDGGNSDQLEYVMMDVNGDGLPDRILKNSKYVQLNLGYSFSEPSDWNLGKIHAGKSTTENEALGINKGSGSVMAGIGVAKTESNVLFSLIDVNGDGLPDIVDIDNKRIALNTGNGFYDVDWKGLTAIEQSTTIGESANAAFTVTFPVPIPFCCILKVAINTGGNVGQSIGRSTLQIRDVDGDGYPEIVSSTKDASMKVYRSTIARTNKLKNVHNPFGGSFILDYKKTPATYDHPGGKWALASVEVNHGIVDQGARMRTEFDYIDGKQDRYEREFLGFSRVITKNVDTENSNALYRSTTQTFDVSHYYSKGNLLNTVVTDAQGKKQTESQNVYYSYRILANGDNYTFLASKDSCSDRAIAFYPLQYTRTVMYEGQPTGLAITASYYEYYLNGNHGELKSYRYSDKGTLAADGSGTYNYQTDITYTGNPTRHIYGLPVSVRVKDNDGKLYREVTAAYDLNYANHLTRVTQTLDENNKAVTDIEYDAAGNIVKKVLPGNAAGQRMEYEYEYDSKYNMYVTRIHENRKEMEQNSPNIYYYSSEVQQYDYRYGIPVRVKDMNGFSSSTTVDNLGRIQYIRGPNEMAEGIPYTIKFEYFTPSNTPGKELKPWYAVTTHYDSQHPRQGIRTVTFVDGVGRPVQVKKSGVITTAQNGTNPEEKEVMIVSGRVKYDPYGRVREAFHPVVEDLDNVFTLNSAFDHVTPTRTSYDVLDRTVTTTLSDGSTAKMEYGLDSDTYTMVTTITDAMGGKQATFTNGSELTLKTEQYSGPDGTITTSFDYDAINQLLTVTDNDGNITRSVYDTGGRRMQVEHPVSGVTVFTYDAAGNMLTKQTANLAASSTQDEQHVIAYGYYYNRLTTITYPDHPENNVAYTYGASNAAQGRRGRIVLQEDATGAQEFSYGLQGELTKVRRTVIIPNQAIATYETEWTYDSWNRLTQMIYPDGEKVTYTYNTAGLLDEVQGERAADTCYYVRKIGYDKFEQRVYLKYGNGAETTYTYDEQRRRLTNLMVNVTPASGAVTQIMNNNYTYDKVDNVLSVVNIAPLSTIEGGIGGQMSHSYGYDGLYRLTSATGTYTGADEKTAGYTLNMAYDNLHKITSKKQDIQQKNLQFSGILKAGYELDYHYNDNPFQISTLDDSNYRTDSTATPVKNIRQHSYDKNGNLIYVATAAETKAGTVTDTIGKRQLLWDEENRLLAINDNGYISNYWYDASGERIIKKSGYGEGIYVNGVYSGGTTANDKFTAYISPYMVVNQGGNYTKHIYIGSQRIISKLGDLANYGEDPRGRAVTRAGSEVENSDINYRKKYDNLLEQIQITYDTLKVLYNGEYNNYDYVDGVGGTAFSIGSKASQTNNSEKLQYFYHSDHLGSTGLITDLDGNIVQHIEYIPFGEVFIDERNNTWNTPYLFNAKELDEETGLYYYGARYYDPRTSVWLSTDPIQEKYPNVSTYTYCVNNPVKYIDPDGEQVIGIHGTWSDSGTWKSQNDILNATQKGFGDSKFCDFNFNWSGKNLASERKIAAEQLIEHIRNIRAENNMQKDEPITLVGHSHGGNVGIEAINIMADMDEFKDVSINLLTINTPVRSDHQLSEKAQSLANHINIYDGKDPVQSRGGSGNSWFSRFLGLFIGEYGKADRKFKNATNIGVSNSQGIFGNFLNPFNFFGDFHNSHNRISDWIDKIPNYENNDKK